ncbi:ATP-binding protein [Aliikangiella sp. IMCC44653]
MNLKQLINFQSTLKSQLIAFLICSILFLSLVTSLTTAWQTSTKIQQSTIETGLRIAKNFAEQSVLAALTASEENAVSALERAIGFESVLAATILSEKGEKLVEKRKQALSLDFEHLTQQMVEPSLVHENDQVWVLAAPIEYEEENLDAENIEPEKSELSKLIIGYVLVTYDKSEMHNIQRSIFTSNILTGLLIAVVLFLIIHWGINKLIAPLIALSETMKVNRDSNAFVKAETRGAEEIKAMAVVFNQMIEKLQSNQVELENHRDTLESEVEIRTMELKVARDTALTASRHKSEFLANISHELRTPLQAIIGYTELVREELDSEGLIDLSDDLAKSTRSAYHLLALINNILDMAKIEAGKMDLYIQAVDLDYLLSDALETIKPMAEANNNRLILVKGELPQQLPLDRQKVMQVLLNLLSNACKFTHDGEVKLSVDFESDSLNITIADTGIGIASDMLDFIFEEFTQVDGSQTRKFEGTGLGMAITKSFCDLMQAKIDIQSELNVGTSFSLKIPVLAKQSIDA